MKNEAEKIDKPQGNGVLPCVSGSLSWIEKDRLAGIRLNEMRALAVDNSILYEVSSKVLRQLIIEGIDIGLNYH
jgi:hypothetical protein